MQRSLRVGIDFDGVLAYNPFRIVRAPITFVKRRLLGATTTEFYIPKSRAEKLIWFILHESSIFPAPGVALLKQLVDDGKIEAHLVTARFRFLQNRLYQWLDRYGLRSTFASITVNQRNQQPHYYKEWTIRTMKFDYYIEDNLDVVTHVVGKSRAKIFWIYNILDRFYPYSHKFPYLKKALEEIVRREKL